MSSKIKIKWGTIEVEYEGPEDYSKQELVNLITTLSEQCSNDGLPTYQDKDSEKTEIHTETVPKQKIKMSISTIAQKTRCNSGPELARAACAYLTIVQGKEEMSKGEIAKCMREAKAYYKNSYGNNLPRTLITMQKAGKLLDCAKDTYALPEIERVALEQIIAS